MNKTTRLMIALVSLGLLGTAYRAEAAGYQMPITFAGYTNRTEVLTNFPVLVVLSNNVGGSGFNFTNQPFLSTNGWDLRFKTNLANTGNATLKYEIESWNTNAAATNFVWVQVPTLATNGNGTIWATWGDAADSNQLVCTTNGATWTSVFRAVWHMNVANNPTDSARFSHDHSVSGASGTGGAVVDGKIGYGLNYSSNGLAPIQNATDLNTTEATFTFWYYPRSQGGNNMSPFTGYGTVFSDGTTGAANGVRHHGTDYLSWRINGSGYLDAPASSGTFNQWHYFAWRYKSGQNPNVWVDGTAVTGAVAFSSLSIGNLIGCSGDNLRCPDGILDEMRMAPSRLSDNWVWASWMNQGSNTLFNSYGTAIGLAAITNRPAESIAATTATLKGYLVSTGGAPTTVYAYWGTDPATWSGASLGVQNVGEVTTNVTGLTGSTSYYYTFMASNAAGVAWAPTTNNFTTLSAGTLTLVSPPACASLGAYGAVLTASLTDTGGAPATVYGYWGTNTATWTETNLGAQAVGTVTNDLTGLLQPETTYYFAFMATNTAGQSSWTTTNSFTTAIARPQIALGSPADNNVTAVSASLYGSLTSTGTWPTTVYCLWGVSNSPQTYTTIDTVPQSGPGPVTNNISSLSQGTAYAFTFMASNNAGAWWAGTTGTFTTLTAPAVNNTAGANPVTPVAEWLQGTVTAGDPTPQAYFCWDTGDQGTTSTGSWSHVIYAGTLLGAFSNQVSGLLPSTTYHYRCYATNSVQGSWSDDASFTTPARNAYFCLTNNQTVTDGVSLSGTNGPGGTVATVADTDGTTSLLYNFVAFLGLNMGGHNIQVNAASQSLKLDMADAGGPITNGGALKTTRSGNTGAIIVTNAAAVNMGDLDSNATADGATAGSISVFHRGSLTVSNVVSAGSPSAFSYGTSGSIAFNGDSGSAAGTRGTFVCGNLDARRGGGDTTPAQANISIQGYTDVLVNGYIASCITYRNGATHHLTIGADATGQRVGNVTIRGGITNSIGGGAIPGPSGNVLIYSTGNVLLQNSSLVAQDIWSFTCTKEPVITIKHDGQLVFNDLLSYTTSINGGGSGGGVTLNGDVLGDGASGSLTGRDVNTSASGTTHWNPPSSIWIGGYTAVALRHVQSYVSSDYADGGSVTVTNVSGPIVIAGDIDTHTVSGTAGGIALTAAGDISVGGTINANAGSGDASDGVLTLTATGAASRITLNMLDMSTVNLAKLTPAKYAYVQTLTTNATTDANLRTDTGKKVFYGGGGTVITQLKAATNATVNAGFLVPGFGNMIADNSNDAGTFGTSLTATVYNASFNVGYDGLRGVVTNATGSGGGATNLGTLATILYGAASSQTAATMAWRTRTTGETNSLISNVVNLGGTGADTYVLQMTYSEAAMAALNKGAEADLNAVGALRPMRYDVSAWEKAGVGSNLGGYANQTTPGNWGVDTTNNVAWVVLHQTGIYAVGGHATASGTMVLLF